MCAYKDLTCFCIERITQSGNYIWIGRMTPVSGSKGSHHLAIFLDWQDDTSYCKPKQNSFAPLLGRFSHAAIMLSWPSSLG